MNPIALALRELRRDTPMAKAARGAVRQVLALRVKPNVVHRLLLAERSLRGLVTGELARALYWQPLFELMCAEVGEGCRLEVCPDSKLPFVDNCELVLGDRVRLTARTTFQGARRAPTTPRIQIGSDSYVGHRVVFHAGTGVTLGRHVMVGSLVTFSGDPGHPEDPILRRTEAAPPQSLGEIVVEDDVWIGYGAGIVGNVRIGRGSIVATRAVVTKDVPPGVIVGGIPARVLRPIQSSDRDRQPLEAEAAA
jgi:serine acetyltransferase